jgi:hypothetical protein
MHVATREMLLDDLTAAAEHGPKGEGAAAHQREAKAGVEHTGIRAQSSSFRKRVARAWA